MEGISEPVDREEMVRAAVSTAAMTNIFTTTVNAALMQAYTETVDTTVGWVRETPVSDFKTNERIQLGKTANLEKHARGGTAEHATREDSLESYKIARYSKQFVVDEQDIIDDRFNALLDMPAQMGAAARRLRPDLVYSILLANPTLNADSTALFHANHGSNTGTDALDAAGIQAGLTVMGKQTQDSVNLNIQPQYLIAPVDLKFDALIALRSADRVISSSSGGTFNPLLNENLELRVDNRLGAAGVTDPATGTAYTGSATNWFLAASPTAAPTIEVGYLNGQQAPMLRSFVLDQGQWGIGWDIKMDIGAKALDFRGLYYSDGTA